jgi:hypothetical protein
MADEMKKITCPRCNGSGNHSFNLIRGTVCFKCDGAGYLTVDAKTHSRNQKAAAKRKEQRDAERELRAKIAAEVSSELQKELGPFPDTCKGGYDMVMACREKHGKTPGEIVQSRLEVILAAQSPK